VLEGNHSLDVEGIKSSVKRISTDIPLQNVKNTLHKGRNAGNIVKNWRKITLKNSRLLISAALEINY
jgi:hypothetical protein